MNQKSKFAVFHINIESCEFLKKVNYILEYNLQEREKQNFWYNHYFHIGIPYGVQFSSYHTYEKNHKIQSYLVIFKNVGEFESSPKIFFKRDEKINENFIRVTNCYHSLYQFEHQIQTGTYEDLQLLIFNEMGLLDFSKLEERLDSLIVEMI